MDVLGADPFFGGHRVAPVAVVLQDVVYMAVLAGADLQGQRARRFEPFFSVALGQRQQTKAGAIAVLRMPVFGHQPSYRFGRRRADTSPPVDQPLRCPFHLGAVGGGHVRRGRGEAADAAIADVAGDTLTTMEELDHRRGDARLDLLADQCLRHAVAVAFDLDVVVNVDLDGFEAGHLVALQRQRQQGRRVDFREGAGAAAWQLLERLVVEPREQRRHGLIDLVHAGELLMAQARHDPALDDLHRRFGLGLVLRMVGPGRQDRGAIVAREVEHRVVAAWLVAVGVGDHRLRIVRHDELRYAAIEAQRARRRFKPVGHGLAWRRAGVGVAGGAQGGHEDVGAAAVGERDGGAGVIDEQLLAGAVDLAHRALELPGEAAVIFAELRVAVGLAIGIVGAVLLPQEHQRHALAAQFLVQVAVVGLDVLSRTFWRNKQAPLQRRLINALDRRPIQARRCGQAKVLGHGSLRHPQCSSDLPVRQLGVELQTQYIFYLTHIDPRCGHAISRKKLKAYPLGCYMRNIISTCYDTVPVS